MWFSDNYDKVHIIAGDYSGCVNIDGSQMIGEGNGVRVTLENGGKLWLSHGTYILVQGKCPICDANKLKNTK